MITLGEKAETSVQDSPAVEQAGGCQQSTADCLRKQKRTFGANPVEQQDRAHLMIQNQYVLMMDKGCRLVQQTNMPSYPFKKQLMPEKHCG
eukprot:1160994-Pelagomonas_calceolata.AAC.6